jgi:chromosome segregation protein
VFLKYLAVEGFKSFPEWNGLELEPGVCVLVGLNGTGKSNLTDAVSWVFGESDPDVLRVRAAGDVVFAGSEELLPTGSAEVTVVIDRRPERQKGESLPATVCKHGHRAEHTGELPEGLVTLTRRWRDDGADEYVLNGCSSERDEVRTVLAEAGLAFPPVSVIRQGELERLLLVDPGERRRLIEKAADVPHIAERLEELHRERGELRLEARAREAEHQEASLSVERLNAEEQAARRRADLENGLLQLRAEGVAAILNEIGSPERTGELLELLALPTPAGPPLPPTGPSSPRERAAELVEELRRLGPVNARAAEDLARASEHAGQLWQARERAESRVAAVEESIAATSCEMEDAFLSAHGRIEERFKAFYSLLAPGGEAALPLVPAEGGLTGVEVVARPPGKILDRVSSLSGGERSLAALSFALAVFHEYPSPFFVLDEVEPALDDSNIRRVQAFLDRVADGRQLLVVSHQQRAKETGDVVFGVERNLDGASQVKFRYEPRSRRLDVFRRTWAADHLRREGARPSPAAGGVGSQVVVGSAGSPTQALFAELFGPASGAKRGDYFHTDGTFRGIWDAYQEADDPEAGEAGPAGPDDEPNENGGDATPPKCCG